MKFVAPILLGLATILGAQTGTSAPQEPSQIVGMGVGVQGLGPAQIQGGYFVAQHIATGRYTIESNDFVRMPGGTVGTSAAALLYQSVGVFGPLSFGMAGGGGVAEGATGSASGTVNGWGVATIRLGKWPVDVMFVAKTTTITGTGQVFQGRVYFAWRIGGK